MPTYCYTCEDCGAKLEQHYPIGKARVRLDCPECGVQSGMRRDFAAEHGGFRHCPGNWPMASDAAGVAPEQVPEFMAFDKAHGVKTEYTPDGRPVFTSAAHRKAYCEAHGLYDRSAGLSDPLPKNRTA